ncbi:outer membrane protein [Allopseudospirillum japonicum]|uniref:Outer membrane protein n=1 Tax=Allopseudospirillum japonicum TaxID=64971 RepID=A0A1H6RJN2_9GAMM|nr:OmpW family outer membrane protein [Allopseudospirillum japonicum]SEI56018.1 outer membrane protein [Allopseudospirillum japonicum]
MKNLKVALLAAAVAAVAQPAFAYDAGDMIVRAGVATVAPNDESGFVMDTSTQDKLLGVEAMAEVDNDSQLGISFTYMLSPTMGIEVLGATPFEHDIKGAGALKGVTIGSTSHLPPTITAQYYPLGGTDSKAQPYVGLGVNYTVFFDEKTTDQFTQTLSGLLNAPGISTDIELDNSFGVAAQLGIDYALTENVMLNAAVWYIDIDTTADVKVNGNTAAQVDVDIDPTVYMLGVGYKF